MPLARTIQNKILYLYNTYTKLKHPVYIKGVPVQTNNDLQTRIQGSFYICGPTVYDHCHVGHALTYIRADLFKRFLRNYLNVDLVTVMNITDIDDKILERSLEVHGATTANGHTTNPSSHPYKKLSDHFYGEFLNDLKLIRAQPADIFLRVTDNMKIIINYIRSLESTGHAYSTNMGDVYFNVAKLPNYVGNQVTTRSAAEISATGKRDPRDFVIWKAQKDNEPAWPYHTKDSYGQDIVIQGRPGWHVQCSALASFIFGDTLDFHFGGKDLIFPHHYNEMACCCAYHNLDPNLPINNWCNHWLHSGHLVISDEKMSKSLSNVISIKDFIGRSSINTLRLLCVVKHYATDLHYTEELITNLKNLDHKLNAFSDFLRSSMKSYEREVEQDACELESTSLTDQVDSALDRILEGICDGFSLSVGLDAILELSKSFYSDSNRRRLNLRELKSASMLLCQWFDSCGLDYGLSNQRDVDSQSVVIADCLSRFRDNIRQISLATMIKSKEKGQGEYESAVLSLKECDRIRAELDSLGIVLRDRKST